MRYLILIEKSKTGYGAFVPDLPGCIAVGDTEKEVAELIKESVRLHLETMREDGDEIPEPSTTSFTLEAVI